MTPKELCSGAMQAFISLLVSLVATTSAWAAHEKILHDFVAFPRGSNAQANLIADGAGDLYGTTANGGRYGYGTVFELTPGKNGKWNQIVLYSFTGGSDGANPVAGLVVDAAGNLYGTTASGGTPQQQCCGLVFELSPGAHGSWTESVLYRFNGSPNDGATPLAGLIFDSAGRLYGTTESGGAYGAGTVFELTLGSKGAWTEAVLYNFTDGADGANPQASLIFDSTGNLYGTAENGGDLNCNGYTTGCGTVFKLTPNGNGTWSQTVIYAFSYVDGASPLSNLIFDSAGNLYGTTPYGPGFACNGGCGIVYRLAPNSDGTWTQTMLYNFAGGADGVEPLAGLVIDGAGNLYGTTEYGGSLGSCYSGCGTVFELMPRSKGNWAEEVIHRFGLPTHGQNDGAQLMAGLLLDPQGNFFGAASGGGSSGGACSNYQSGGCGTVFKLTQVNHKWTSSLVYAFPPGSEGLDPRAGLVADSAGNLYGTTGTGGKNDCSSGGDGANGCGTVFELKSQSGGGWKGILLHTFSGISDGAGPAANLISDASGNLYGTTSNGGSANCIGFFAPCGGTVFELSPTAQGWKETVLHTFHVKPGNQNGDGGRPLSGLVMDSSGNLYGTTSLGGSHSSNCTSYQYIGCGTVFKVSPDGTGKWKEELLYVFQGGSDGNGPLSTLVFDGAGNLYGTTCGGGTNGEGTVFELSPTSGGKWKESTLYSFQGYRSGDGSCPYAGVIFDPNGNLYGTTYQGGNITNSCSNGGCGVVFELSPAGGVWKETVLLAFQGTEGSNPNGGLTFDAAGNLYGSAPYNGADYGILGGVVFELSPGSKGWTEHVLHHFGTGLDGIGPNGTLILDAAGNVFGTTGSGGKDIVPTDIGGTVFELSTASDGEWVDNLVVPPPPPLGFTPSFRPDSKSQRRFVRNIPDGR